MKGNKASTNTLDASKDDENERLERIFTNATNHALQLNSLEPENFAELSTDQKERILTAVQSIYTAFEAAHTNSKSEAIYRLLVATERLWEMPYIRAQLAISGIVPILVENMKVTGPIQVFSLKIIRSLSLITEGREELVKNCAVKNLVALIRSSSPEVMSCALRATFNLSVVNVDIRKLIVSAGALPLLIQAALKPSGGQCAAIGTLANLATESEIKRSIVLTYNGLGPLLSLLESHDDSILTHACRALFAIAANDDNKIAIAEAGGLPKLLRCMEIPVESVLMNAAGALANLAIHPINKLKLVEYGALPKLRALAYSNNSKIQRQVARCLFALAAHVDNRRAIIEGKCLTALVRLLNSFNHDVQLNAAGAVGNIAMTDSYKSEVVEAGALDRLVQLASRPIERVQRQAARAIFTLTAKDIAKTRLAKLEGLPSLILLTQAKNEDIQRDAAGALANMAIGTDHKDSIVKLGGLKPLIKLLKSGVVPVQRQSARAIFALAGTEQNQREILKDGGLEPLISLLVSENDEVQKHACGAVANLSNRYPNKVIQYEGALETLVDIVFTHPNVEVRRQAYRGVHNLFSGENTQRQMTMNPYAGKEGEQRRLRHDMRSLFQATMQNQSIARNQYERYLNSINRTSSPVTNTLLSSSDMNIKSPKSQTTSKKRRRAVSSDHSSIPNFATAAKDRGLYRRRFAPSQKLSYGLDCDVHLILPLPSDTNVTFGEREALNEDGMEDRSVSLMVFVGHSAILAARCSLFNTLIADELNRIKERKARLLYGSDYNVDPALDGDLHFMELEDETCGAIFVRIPDRYAHSKAVWYAFLEFLYTDSVRLHAQSVRDSGPLAKELCEFALLRDMPRLGCYCTELYPRFASDYELLYKEAKSGGSASTWMSDMSRLLNCTNNDGLLTPSSRTKIVDLTDVKLEVAEEFHLDTKTDTQMASASPNNRCPTIREPKRLKCLTGSPIGIHSRQEQEPKGFMNVHRIMLSARCSYFKALFGCSAWADSSASRVKFDGSETALKIMLRYIYCGIEDLGNEDASIILQVLVLANEYGLDGLQLYCEQILTSYISPSTVLVMLQELDIVHAPLLRSMCIHFLVNALLCENSSIAKHQVPQTLRDELAATTKTWGFPDIVFESKADVAFVESETELIVDDMNTTTPALLGLQVSDRGFCKNFMSERVDSAQ